MSIEFTRRLEFRALIKIPAKKGDHKDRPYGAIRRFR